MFVFPVSLLHARKGLFCYFWLKKLQNDKNCSISKSDTRRIKFLEREINFCELISPEARYPVVKTLKITFWLKAFFLNLKLRRRLKHCAIFQKLFHLKIFEKYVGCSFDNHAGKFSLKVREKLRSKPWNEQNSNFFPFDLIFSLVCSSRHFLQFRQPWK